jgi:hypothetical protein
MPFLTTDKIAVFASGKNIAAQTCKRRKICINPRLNVFIRAGVQSVANLLSAEQITGLQKKSPQLKGESYFNSIV